MRNTHSDPIYRDTREIRQRVRPVRVEPPAVARYPTEYEYLQGFLARARNVNHGGRRPIAFSGARSEAVPRARSGSSLTVCRLSLTDTRLTTIVVLISILFSMWIWISQSEFSLWRLELCRGAKDESASSLRLRVDSVISLALSFSSERRWQWKVILINVRLRWFLRICSTFVKVHCVLAVCDARNEWESSCLANT